MWDTTGYIQTSLYIKFKVVIIKQKALHVYLVNDYNLIPLWLLIKT